MCKKGKPTSKKFVILFALLGLFIFKDVNAVYSLPDDRSIKWQGNVGVLGDIPKRETICSTLNPSGGDDTLAIQTAINNCPVGQVVKLSQGTFNISATLSIKKGIVLRGAGQGATNLKGSVGFVGTSLISVVPASWSWNMTNFPSINLASGYSKGSNNITTATAHGLSVGDMIVIDQLNNPLDDPPVTNQGNDANSCTWCGRENGSRALGQVAKVTSVPNSTSFNIEIPLYWNFDSALSPQLVKMSQTVSFMGIEDLTINNGESMAKSSAVTMQNTANSWISNVEIIGSYKTHLTLYSTYRVTIRNSKFHEGIPVSATSGDSFGPNRGYSIWTSPWVSASLIENNEFYHCDLALTMNGVSSGNVFAYNYVHDMYSLANFQMHSIIPHGAHPIMNLFEGNLLEARAGADYAWGGSSNNVFFRNKISTTGSQNSGNWVVDLEQGNEYYSFIGNVLGTLSRESIYEKYVPNSYSNTEKYIYWLGYYNMSLSTNGSTAVRNTLLRHANWDSVTKGVVYNASDDQILPNSMYMTEKPAWWCNETTWPAINPVGPTVSDIPAKRRNDNASCTLGTQTPTPPPPPAPVTYSITDFTNLVTDWLKTIASPADVNKDGTVNTKDLGIMMSSWK